MKFKKLSFLTFITASITIGSIVPMVLFNSHTTNNAISETNEEQIAKTNIPPEYPDLQPIELKTSNVGITTYFPTLITRDGDSIYFNDAGKINDPTGFSYNIDKSAATINIKENSDYNISSSVPSTVSGTDYERVFTNYRFNGKNSTDILPSPSYVASPFTKTGDAIKPTTKSASVIASQKSPDGNSAFQTFSYKYSRKTASGLTERSFENFIHSPDGLYADGVADSKVGNDLRRVNFIVAQDFSIEEFEKLGTSSYVYAPLTFLNTTRKPATEYKTLKIDPSLKNVLDSAISSNKTVEQTMPSIKSLINSSSNKEFVIVDGINIFRWFEKFSNVKIEAKPFDGEIDIVFTSNIGFSVDTTDRLDNTTDIFNNWQIKNNGKVEIHYVVSGFRKVEETKIVELENYDTSMKATDLATYVASGGVGGTINRTRLEEFTEITGMPPELDAKLTLIQSITTSDSADVTLVVATDKWYDKYIGAYHNTPKEFRLDFTLSESRKQTEIVLMEDLDYTMTHQEIRNVITDNAPLGLKEYLVDLANLSSFIDTSYFPDDAKIYISNIEMGKEPIENKFSTTEEDVEYLGFLSFNLKTDKIINQYGLDEKNIKNFPVKIPNLKLLPESEPTIASSVDIQQTAWDYEQKLFHEKGDNIDIDVLSEAVDITTFVESTNYKVSNLKPEKYVIDNEGVIENKSKLNFTLEASNFVDDNGVINFKSMKYDLELLDLRTPNDSFPLLKTTYDNDKDVELVVSELSSLPPNSNALKDMLSIYFDLSSFPPLTLFSINDISVKKTEPPYGVVSLKIQPTMYIDEYEKEVDFDPAKPKYYEVEINNLLKISDIATEVQYKNFSNYRASEVVHLINEHSSDIELLTETLSKIIDFKSFPKTPDGVYDISLSNIVREKGQLSFSLSTGLWFDSEGIVQKSISTFDYTFQMLNTSVSKAVSKEKVEYKGELTHDYFARYIGGLNKQSNSNIYQFIDQSQFPTFTKFTINSAKVIDTDDKKGADFSLIPDYYFDDNGDVVKNTTNLTFEFSSTFKVSNTMTIVAWVCGSVGVALLFTFLIVMYLKVWKRKKDE
ncbi:MAG: hypothetical protein ACRC4M_00170 [Mycoplasma sp.]